MLKCFVLAISIFFSWSALADQYFDNLRDDKTIPQHCKETKISHFVETPELFFVSIDGAKAKGFDIEFPLSRSGATRLWEAIKKPGQYLANLKKAAEKEPRLLEYYSLMKRFGPQMGIDFGNEGDVLEILALLELKEYYDSEIYFFYGGAAYHEVGGRTLGELDLMVADKETCEVVAIGEAKLGIRALRKARGQLHRFLGFLRNN